MGKRIGLKKIDIENILNNKKIYPENIHLSAGPIYGGGWYGTISLHDF
jgi:hypothetical protein